MDSQLPDEIARTVLAAYAALPKNGKPRQLSPSQHSWTVLAAFCLLDRAARGPEAIKCVSMGTGLKCLPRARLPPHGDVLHDSHAEVIAHRGVKLWLYDQLVSATRGEESCLTRDEASGRWGLRSGLELGLYVSTLPCGDASTYTLSLLSPDDAIPQGATPTAAPTATPSTLEAAALGLHTLRSTPKTAQTRASSSTNNPAPTPPSATTAVHRGRTAYAAFSALRTKPGRLDSPPTTSHSCSDKIAMWAYAGLEGSLLSAAGMGRVPLAQLVVGGVSREVEGGWERVGEEVRRAVGGRVRWPKGEQREQWEGAVGLGVPEVVFTDVEYEGHKEVVQVRVEERVAVVSCMESMSFVDGRGVEVLLDGKRQGSGSKRKPGEALPPKSRSRLCKLALLGTHLVLTDSPATATDPSTNPTPPGAASYFALKHGPAATTYRARKAAVRAPGAPFEGWLVHGEAWEGFGQDGRLVADEAEAGDGGA